MLVFDHSVASARLGDRALAARIHAEGHEAAFAVAREQGFDMTVGSWQGIFVPKGTPRSIVNKLFQVGQETMKSPDVVKKLTESGATVVVSKSPEDFGAFQKRENDRFAKAVKEGGIETQ